jgi:hypothetical protein
MKLIENIKIKDFWERKGRNSRPIPDSEVINFVNAAVSPKYLYDETIKDRFVERYYDWVQQSKLNTLSGLDKFNSVDFVHGTSQAFDFWYQKHHNKRFRSLKGEYAYHKVSWKNYFEWEYFEDDELRSGDALIISVPFSDLGAKHPETESILDKCDELGIPVFIDAAYYCIVRDLDFNLDRPCIDTIAFSMSKACYGAERLRIGIRCRRQNDDDGCVLFNQFHCVAKIAAGVGYQICENFDIDYNQNKFREKQLEICKELRIQPSDSVLFGLATPDHPEFGDYDRGTEWRRVCISRLLGDCHEFTI